MYRVEEIKNLFCAKYGVARNDEAAIAAKLAELAMLKSERSAQRNPRNMPLSIIDRFRIENKWRRNDSPNDDSPNELFPPPQVERSTRVPKSKSTPFQKSTPVQTSASVQTSTPVETSTPDSTNNVNMGNENKYIMMFKNEVVKVSIKTEILDEPSP